MSVLIIITESNGAGKSSVGPDYVPKKLRNSIFDGDKLFMQKKSDFWAQGVRPHKECRKLAGNFVGETFDMLVAESLEKNIDFAYEGHFTNDATWDIPKKFKEAGYKIHLIFFGLTNISSSYLRVVARLEEGGHYVDPITVEENFYGNLVKLDKYFPIFDSVKILDTSGIEHIELVNLKNGIPSSAIPSNELPEWFIQNLQIITNLITEAELDLQ